MWSLGASRRLSLFALQVDFSALLPVVSNLLEKSACFEDEESGLFIEVDCFNVEPVLCPAPEALSQQQVCNFPNSNLIQLCLTL